MKNISRITLRSLCVLQVTWALSVANAQNDVPQSETVAYRLRTINTLHFDDPAKAREHLETVKRLGCEAQIEDHGGHLDVSYRLETWKSLTLASKTTAQKWNDWMKRAGFETLHAYGLGHNHGAGQRFQGGHQHSLTGGHYYGDGHDHGHTTNEILTYSLANWQVRHTEDRAEAAELVAVLKGLGCEVRTEAHNDHDDVVFRCPEPKHIELPSHQVASGWEGWLKSSGFETRHVH